MSVTLSRQIFVNVFLGVFWVVNLNSSDIENDESSKERAYSRYSIANVLFPFLSKNKGRKSIILKLEWPLCTRSVYVLRTGARFLSILNFFSSETGNLF